MVKNHLQRKNLLPMVLASCTPHNIEREDPFEAMLLVCKVAKRVIVFPSEWEMWKRFLQGVVSFSNVKNLFLKVSSFKVKVFGRKLF
jgi:hypothetical protein